MKAGPIPALVKTHRHKLDTGRQMTRATGLINGFNYISTLNFA